jgi:hypothetical protein
MLGCGGLLIFVGGPVAVLGIFAVRKYMQNAKAVEGRSSLRQIETDAVAAFERGTPNARGQSVKAICPSASATVPRTILAVKGMKYQSAPAEWTADAARHAGFACLGFSLSAPQYFLYRYTAQGSSNPGDRFTAEADADLTATGELLTLQASGRVTPSNTLDVEPVQQVAGPSD